MRAGTLRHSIRLQVPTNVADADGGYVEDPWVDLNPAPVRAAIAPASASQIERVFGGAVEAVATHLVTIRYHPQVTTKTRVVFNGRILRVCGIVNVDERNIELRLACQETL